MPHPHPAEVEIEHPYWKDRILLYSNGGFKRLRSECAGMWKWNECGMLRLDWANWPSETFAPDLESQNPVPIYRLSRSRNIRIGPANSIQIEPSPRSAADNEEGPPVEVRPRIRLTTSYYTDSNMDRQKELDACLSHNLRNPFIDEVVVLNESDRNDFSSDKVVSIRHPRPTFGDLFSVIDELTHRSDINILVNSDIYLDDSVQHLSKFELVDTVLALQRWEIGMDAVPVQPTFRPDSQDAWIWQGRMKPLGHDNFHLGKPGCDNRIAWEFMTAGYSVVNPCTLIRAIHLHQSGVRRYGPDDVVSPPYHHVVPS